MTLKEALKIVMENCDHGYDGSEYEEMEEVIKTFYKACSMVSEYITNGPENFYDNHCQGCDEPITDEAEDYCESCEADATGGEW